MDIFIVIGTIIGIFIGVIVLYLIVIIFAPGFHVPRQPVPIMDSATNITGDKLVALRRNVSFQVQGLEVSGWLYLPEDVSAPVPCIVMNTGFGGTKDMILESYALRFQEAGIAVLTYDYRYFGESEGEPRQLFIIRNQVEDCSAAIEFVRSLPEIDAERIALWGTSAGGGYGLVLAARDKHIACVCAQCSGLDRKEDGRVALDRESIVFFLRLFMHAQRDKGRSRFGLSAHKIPIVGKPGTLAMITAPGAFAGYAKLASKSFVNEVCARALLMSQGFNPIDSARDVRCPVLLQVCEQDNLVSMNSVIRAAEILGEYAEVKKYPIDHFDIYSGEHFERSVSDQIDFFQRHL